MELLLSNEIADAVKKVLKGRRDDRIVAVAFVGRDPLNWIDQPRGIQLYCWPKPGATHPDGIRALLAAGVEVHFVDRLHMKIYWARNGGTVLGSANLSANALSNDGLHEAAVCLAPEEFDISAVLDQFRHAAISSNDVRRFRTALATLDREHVAYAQRNPNTDRIPRAKRVMSFGEWLDSPFRKSWQIDYWTTNAGALPTDPLDETGEWPYKNAANFDSPNALQRNIPTLEIKLDRSVTKLVKRTRPFWWYPERWYKTKVQQYLSIPYTWVCQERVPAGAEVPFNAGEPAFVDALARATSEALDNLRNVNGYIDLEFVDALAHFYKPSSTGR